MRLSLGINQKPPHSKSKIFRKTGKRAGERRKPGKILHSSKDGQLEKLMLGKQWFVADEIELIYAKYIFKKY